MSEAMQQAVEIVRKYRGDAPAEIVRGKVSVIQPLRILIEDLQRKLKKKKLQSLQPEIEVLRRALQEAELDAVVRSGR